MQNNTKSPIWEWFLPPIHGDLGAVLSLFYITSLQYVHAFCSSVRRSEVETIELEEWEEENLEKRSGFVSPIELLLVNIAAENKWQLHTITYRTRFNRLFIMSYPWTMVFFHGFSIFFFIAFCTNESSGSAAGEPPRRRHAAETLRQERPVEKPWWLGCWVDFTTWVLNKIVFTYHYSCEIHICILH